MKTFNTLFSKKHMDYVIGGNWKMQYTSLAEAVENIKQISGEFPSLPSTVKAFIAPSFPMIYQCGKVLDGKTIELGSQDVAVIEKGALTGEVSIHTLKEAGCKYVILGHSERRRILNELDALINIKLQLVLDHGLIPILCVGETAKERDAGKTKGIIFEQLLSGLKGIVDISKIVIAYEPVWAINNRFLNPGGNVITAATPEQAQEIHADIRDWMLKRFGEIAEKIPIIYGGSMNSDNVEELLKQPDINGGLVGGASLKAETFLPIIQTAIKLAKK